jgi:hypothetical protein
VCSSIIHPSIHSSIHLFLKKDGWIGPRADKAKKKKNKVRSTFALPSITIICTYDFGGVGGFISAPFSILEKRGGLVFFRFIEANWFRVRFIEANWFRVRVFRV